MRFKFSQFTEVSVDKNIDEREIKLEMVFQLMTLLFSLEIRSSKKVLSRKERWEMSCQVRGVARSSNLPLGTELCKAFYSNIIESRRIGPNIFIF